MIREDPTLKSTAYSPWRRVTQSQIDAFADAAYDRQYLHVDPDKAAAGPFGAPIAHGFFILSLLVDLRNASSFASAPETTEINYGVDRLRFPNAVRCSSRIRAGFRLVESQPKAGGTLKRFAVTVEIEGEAKPAAVCEWLLLVLDPSDKA